MYNNIIYIVGDKFSAFTEFQNVFTYSEIVKKILKNETEIKNVFFVVGQGVNQEEKIKLEKLTKKHEAGFILNAYQKPAASSLTHKHKSENIIISDPLMLVQNKLYRSYLLIDDNCAEMNDHVTGLHVQGMIITEAARQMVLAVGEKFILNSDERGNFYCVLSNLSSQFLNFAFPVDLEIEHEIIEIKNLNRRYDVKTKTSFIQNQSIAAIVNIDYVFSEKEIMKNLEKKIAKNMINKNRTYHLNNLYLESIA